MLAPRFNLTSVGTTELLLSFYLSSGGYDEGAVLLVELSIDNDGFRWAHPCVSALWRLFFILFELTCALPHHARSTGQRGDDDRSQRQVGRRRLGHAGDDVDLPRA